MGNCSRKYSESVGSDDDALPLKVNEVFDERVELVGQHEIKYIEHRHLRYLYDERAGKYVLLR